MEDLERVGLLAHRDKLDGLARHRTYGECAATAGVAIELGHDDAIEVHALGEGLNHVHDVLAGHGVDHHEDLVGLDGLLDGDRLLHHLLVDLKAASGIHNHDVVQVIDSLVDGLGGNLDRVLAVTAIDRHANLGTKGGKLVGSCGTVRVAGGKQRRVALALQEIGELGRGRGLARALQAHEHDHVGRAVLRQHELGLVGAEKLGELVEHDAHHVLRRRERVQDLGREALLLAGGDKVLDHAEVDVGLEQGHADLAHGHVDVGLGELALAAELVKGVLEAFGEAVEHGYFPSPTSARQKSSASKVSRSSMDSPTPMR